jgi:hypothetical protein
LIANSLTFSMKSIFSFLPWNCGFNVPDSVGRQTPKPPSLSFPREK